MNKLEKEIKNTKFVSRKLIQFGPFEAVITCNCYGEFGFYPKADFDTEEQIVINDNENETSRAVLYRCAIYDLYSDWFKRTEKKLMNKIHYIAVKHGVLSRDVESIINDFDLTEETSVWPNLLK